MPRSRSFSLAFLLFSLVVPGVARAVFDSGSTGADGAFAPASDVLVDLSLAGSGPGNGVYDAAKWAVIFHYTTVTVPAGVTVRFKNHPSGAPVVWLATGDVHIAGTVVLDGADGEPNGTTYADPGPGGFEGGRGGLDPNVSPSTAGFGPGGGEQSALGSGAGYGTLGVSSSGSTYGNEAVLPLIGGSGGSGSNCCSGGGGGGAGAILIASSDSITLSLGGLVRARGGNQPHNNGGGGGSGGGIRLIANHVGGDGFLRALGGVGGNFGSGNGGRGRIRVEAGSMYLTDPGDPTFSISSVTGPIFPAAAPTLAVTSLTAGSTSYPVPADPLAGIELTDLVVGDSATVQVTFHIAATNVPPGTPVHVLVGRDAGPRDTLVSTPLSGTLASSTASALGWLFTGRKAEIQLRAEFGGGSLATSRPVGWKP